MADEPTDDGQSKYGRRLDQKTWLAIRTAVVVKHYTLAQAAEEFKVNITTVKKRASKEGWIKERNRATTNAQGVVTEALQNAVTDALLQHVTVADRYVELAREIADKLSEKLGEDKPPLRSIAETGKFGAEMLEKGMRLGRMARGIANDEPSDPNASEDGGPLVIEQRRLDPKPIPVDAGGRALTS